MESSGEVPSLPTSGLESMESTLHSSDSEMVALGQRLGQTVLSDSPSNHGIRTSPIPHIEVCNVQSSDTQEGPGDKPLDADQEWPKGTDGLGGLHVNDAPATFRRKSDGDLHYLKVREEGATGGQFSCEYNGKDFQKVHSYDSPLCPLSPWRKKRSSSLTYDLGLPREFPAPMTVHISDNKVVPAPRRRSFTAELLTLEPIVEDSLQHTS